MPTHKFGDVGVTVIVAVIGALVLFVAVNEGTEPEPDAAKPIAVFELVQENVVLATSALND